MLACRYVSTPIQLPPPGAVVVRRVRDRAASDRCIARGPPVPLERGDRRIFRQARPRGAFFERGGRLGRPASRSKTCDLQTLEQGRIDASQARPQTTVDSADGGRFRRRARRARRRGPRAPAIRRVQACAQDGDGARVAVTERVVALAVTERVVALASR